MKNFDICIVAIGDDFQSSLETTSLLEELGAQKVIARAARDVHAKFLLRNGADEIVYPEKQLAVWTAIRYTSDHILDYIQLDGNFAIFEVTIPKTWRGKTAGSIRTFLQIQFWTKTTPCWYLENIQMYRSASTSEVIPELNP